MDAFLLIARIFLAGVFGVAGVAKAADPAGSRRAMVSFGVPERIAGLFGRVLPYAELLVALALLPLVSAWWSALAALMLLLLFTVAIGVSLARGQAPDCRCFGQLHSRPVNRMTFLRNILLAAVAGFIVLQGRGHPGMSAFDWPVDLKVAEVVNLLIAVCGVGLLVIALGFLKRVLKQQETLLEKIEVVKAALDEEGDLVPVKHKGAAPLAEGLPIGARAPGFSLASVGGGNVTLNNLLEAGKPLVLLFVGPNCWGCKLLLPAVRIWQREYADRLNIAVLSHGGQQENQAKMARYEMNEILLDQDSAVADEYQAKWTPAALLINPDGKIGSQIIYADNFIREWFRNLMASDTIQPALVNGHNGKPANDHLPQVALRYAARQIGEPCPAFSLLDLSGKVVSHADLLGSPTLLLFWHPGCQFCQAMTDDIRRWEEDPPEESPKLVFIASGNKDEIRVLNRDFDSLTLFDPGFDIALLFGTMTTPTAVLIDAEGRVASSLAMGGPNVRALIGLRKVELELAAQA